MDNERRPSGHVVALAATLDHDIGEDAAVVAARAWADRVGLARGMTSWDGMHLRVSGMVFADGMEPATLVGLAVDSLAGELRSAGATVTAWESVEVLAPHIVEQRLARRALPPTVTTREFADLAGVTPSRIRQLAAQRAAGERDDFPHPLLDGHWLAAEAKHWAATRRTRPGPAPGTPAAHTPRVGEVAT